LVSFKLVVLVLFLIREAVSNPILNLRDVHLTSPIYESQPAEGIDDDDAIAYAWSNEDGSMKRYRAEVMIRDDL
jgi:hypothetical protein